MNDLSPADQEDVRLYCEKLKKGYEALNVAEHSDHAQDVTVAEVAQLLENATKKGENELKKLELAFQLRLAVTHPSFFEE